MEDQTKAGSAAAPTSPSSAPRSGAQTEDPVATPTAGEPTGAPPAASSDDHQATVTMVSTSDPAASKPVREADPIAELAASCAIENSFSHDVLRQSNVTLAALGGDAGAGGGRERMVCTTDAEKGSAAFAAAEDARLRREKEARRAKEREAKEKAKIPSLKDFKSDIAAKVSAAKAAKEEPKEHKEPQKDKDKEHKEGHATSIEPNVSDQNATGTDRADAAGEPPAPSPGTDADVNAEGNANRTGSDVAGSISGDANSTATTEEERERRAGAPGAGAPKGAGSAKGAASAAEENRGERRGGGDEKAGGEPASEPERDDAAPDADAVAGAAAGARSSAEPAHPGAAEEDEGGGGGGKIEARSEPPAAPATSATSAPSAPSATPEDQPAAAPSAAPAAGATDGDPAVASAPAAAPAAAEEEEEDPWIMPASASEGEAFIRQYNYASYANGARVVSSNPESKSAGAALKEDMDSYYLTPCAAKNGRWLTVELSEEAAVTAVTLANYEFHSSGVREFEVWASAAGAHDREEDWRRLGRCRARDGRDVQTFVLPRGHWSKYVRVSMTSHYGRHHFCTLSLLRVHGKDAKQTLEEEMEAINREVAEVEEILNAGDDYEPAGEAVQSGGGSGDDDKPAAEDEVQVADTDSPSEPGAAPEPPIEPSIGTPDGTLTAPPTELPADAGPGATSEAKPPGESDSAGADASAAADDKKEGFFKSWFGKEKEAASKEEAAKEAASKEEAAKEEAAKEARDSPPRPDHALTDPAKEAASKSRSDEEKEDDGSGSGGEDTVGVEPPASAETAPGSSERSSSEEAKTATADAREGGEPSTETPTTPPAAEAAAQPIQPTAEEAAAAAQQQQQQQQPPTVGKDDRPLPAVPKPAVSEQRPSSPENVFSLMAKKIKSLELNQSMFDRYIESLSASYGGRFEDIAQEVNDLEELVANQTSALVELDKALDKATRGAKSDLSVAIERVGRDWAKNARETAADVRDKLASVERRWELYLGLTMFAVATVLGVAAFASGAQAALVLWREGAEPSERARLAAKVTAVACVVAGALSLGCYFAAAWLVFGRMATSVWAAGVQAAGAAFGYLRMNMRRT